MNNNDLISREALKKALSDKDLITWTHEYGDAIPLEWIMSTIDNAPTVDLWEMRQEATENALKKAEVLYGRPQGEWVENLMHNTICSNCGGIRRDNRVDYIAFCNKCGADMRKGGAE